MEIALTIFAAFICAMLPTLCILFPLQHAFEQSNYCRAFDRFSTILVVSMQIAFTFAIFIALID